MVHAFFIGRCFGKHYFFGFFEYSANFVFSDTSNSANVIDLKLQSYRFINTKSWIPWLSMFFLSMKFLIASSVITITRGSTITVDLASLGTISSCNYIQIPFSETGSILQSITFSGVNQSKLRICFIIDYYWNVFWLFNKLLNSFSLQFRPNCSRRRRHPCFLQQCTEKVLHKSWRQKTTDLHTTW